MANTWSAGQYRRAAEAHKKVCDYMLENIENTASFITSVS